MLKINEDERGRLISLNDLVSSVPFDVKRFMEIMQCSRTGKLEGITLTKQTTQILYVL